MHKHLMLFLLAKENTELFSILYLDLFASF